MKHTFESVLPLFVAALGEPQRRFDADDVLHFGYDSASWYDREYGPFRHKITIDDEDGALYVYALGASDTEIDVGRSSGWLLNADDAAVYHDPVATPEEALRLAREWAKVPT